MTIDYKITETYENYLEAIYNMLDEVSATGQKIINARLADRLGVKPPTVSQTLQRMSRDGLVKIDEGDIALTRHGTEVAEASIRRHRIIERFMSDILGIEWAVAHREAERLQHAISPLIEGQMLAALGHPTACPHGNPIPGMMSTKLPAEALTLDKTLPQQAVEILRITEEGERDPRLLDYLQKQRLIPGARITVQEVVEYTGVVTFMKDDNTIALGLKAAHTIWVKPV
jgi:DtxR family transcriptional regulator, Mn-dependent transcriptional regulator